MIADDRERIDTHTCIHIYSQHAAARVNRDLTGNSGLTSLPAYALKENTKLETLYVYYQEKG